MNCYDNYIHYRTKARVSEDSHHPIWQKVESAKKIYQCCLTGFLDNTSWYHIWVFLMIKLQYMSSVVATNLSFRQYRRSFKLFHVSMHYIHQALKRFDFSLVQRRWVFLKRVNRNIRWAELLKVLWYRSRWAEPWAEPCNNNFHELIIMRSWSFSSYCMSIHDVPWEKKSSECQISELNIIAAHFCLSGHIARHYSCRNSSHWILIIIDVIDCVISYQITLLITVYGVKNGQRNLSTSILRFVHVFYF